MYEIINAGGLVMWLIVVCSIVAISIIASRLIALRSKKINPPNLVAEVWTLQRKQALKMEHIKKLRASSPLGRILAAGLANSQQSREIMKEVIEETGKQEAHELDRFLNTLGTIAAITPLLGLLGTVFGMIEVFSAITTSGVGDPNVLAGGISKALLTTAAGLCVAIPSLMFHRYLSGKVNDLVMGMETEALKMVEVMHGDRARNT